MVLLNKTIQLQNSTAATNIYVIETGRDTQTRHKYKSYQKKNSFV